MLRIEDSINFTVTFYELTVSANDNKYIRRKAYPGITCHDRRASSGACPLIILGSKHCSSSFDIINSVHSTELSSVHLCIHFGIFGLSCVCFIIRVLVNCVY